jgi:hypothetical protein
VSSLARVLTAPGCLNLLATFSHSVKIQTQEPLAVASKGKFRCLCLAPAALAVRLAFQEALDRRLVGVVEVDLALHRPDQFTRILTPVQRRNLLLLLYLEVLLLPIRARIVAVAVARLRTGQSPETAN